MKMSRTPITLLAAMIFIAIIAVGCETKTAQQRNAELRWQKTLEQAKLEFAQQYVDQGQFVQATAILEPMIVKDKIPEAEILLDEIEQRQIQYASAIQSIGNSGF